MSSSRKTKVLIISLGQCLSIGVSMLVGIITARLLSLEQVATYNQTMLAYDFARPLLTLGIPGSLIYFLTGVTKRQRGIIIDNIAILTFMGFVFCAFMLFGGTELLARRFSNPELRETLKIFTFFPLVTFPVMGLGSVFVIRDRIPIYTALTVGQSIFSFLLVGIVCFCLRDVSAMLKTRLIAATIIMPVYFILTFRIVREGLDWPRLSKIFAILKYAVPLGLASMLGSICLQVDKIIVSAFCSTADFAVYSMGAKEIPVVNLITASISMIMLVEFRKFIVDDDFAGALRVYRLATTKISFALFPVMGALVCLAGPLIITMYSSKYMGSIIPFTIYSILLINRVSLFGALAALGKQNEVLFQTLITCILDAVISYVLVRLIGYNGAALGTLIVSFSWAMTSRLYLMSRGLKTVMRHVIEWDKVLGNLALALIPAAAVFLLLLPLNNVLPAAVRLIFGGIVYVALWFALSRKYRKDELLDLWKFAAGKLKRSRAA